MNLPNQESDPTQSQAILVQATPAPSGLKSIISGFPGIMVAHRLIKNLRYLINDRTGTIGGIKRAQMSVEEAANYTNSIFQKIDGLVRANDGWKNKNILEIGPGDSLGTGLWCLAAGAKSYTAIDRFAVGLDKEFENNVLNFIKGQFGENGNEYPMEICEDRSVKNARFRYLNDVPIENAPGILGRSQFDVIFSNAVLEHVRDVELSLHAMKDLLNDGGIMFHDVDLRSHQTYENHPLQFLEYNNTLWKLMSSHNGEPNRVRMPDYLKIIAKLGFQILDTGVNRAFSRDIVERHHSQLATEFHQMPIEDLIPAVFWFTCRKLPSPPIED